MIELQVPEQDPIEAALIAWFPQADLYRDGKLERKGVNLLGSNEIAARAYAKVIAGHVAAGPTDRDRLAAFLLSREAAQHVRAYSSAPIIAEGVLVMLTERGLL